MQMALTLWINEWLIYPAARAECTIKGTKHIKKSLCASPTCNAT